MPGTAISWRHRRLMDRRVKKVFLEPAWKMRRDYQDLIMNPPPGYEFVVEQTVVEGIVRRLANADFAYAMHRWLRSFSPVELAKPWWERAKGLPENVDITYAVFHPVFRKEPWLLDLQLEQPHLLVGGETVFERWKGLIKGALLGEDCRKIICQLDAGRTAFLQRMGWTQLEEKVEVVHFAVGRKEFAKEHNAGKIKLLFVNSANINAAEHFYTHGGMIVLEVFKRLCQKYDNLELVIRSGLPRGISSDLARSRNVTVYEDVIPWSQLEAEFKSADIFLYPTFVTPTAILLDAMSYELPVVTTDVWGNGEMVEDKKTGLLAEYPGAAEYTDGFVVHFDSKHYQKAIHSVNHELVEAVVHQTSVLIEDEEMRRRMGRAGRWEVEHGKFSMDRRNNDLMRVLDEATAG